MSRPESTDNPGMKIMAASDELEAQRMAALPKEVGVMLMSIGVLGVVLPGMMGAPAIVAGGLVLWPRSFRGIEEWLRERKPGLHRRGMRQISRFVSDLERRFPDLTRK